MRRERSLILLLISALWPTALAAQLPQPGTGTPPAPQIPQGPPAPTPTTQQPTTDQMLENRRTSDPDLENVVPVWRPSPEQRSFQGFPIFPPEYGGYPRRPGTLRDLFREMPVAPRSLVPTVPALPTTGWPSWLRTAPGETLPYRPDVGMLVRNADRVWWKPVTEDAFVPLYFYDKLRTIHKDTEVEVRQVGEFELLLHGGSRVVVQGVTSMKIEELSETLIALQFRDLTNVRLEAHEREHRIGLPDGSTVFLRPKPRPTAGETSAPMVASPFGESTALKTALLVFERQYEPGWRSARATIWNGGELPVEWKHAFGTTEIAAGQRVTFFFEPSVAAVPAALQSEQVDLAPDGAAMRCKSVGAGQVVWSGARFRLPDGAVLRLDPLLGEPFAPR